MREQEMRMRVFRFLKARMRNMIMPATVGIGLAVGGCAKETSTPIYSAPLQDSGPPAQTDVLLKSDTLPSPSDSATPGSDTMAPAPDSSDTRPGPSDSATPGSDTMAPAPDIAPPGPDSSVPGREVAPDTSEVPRVADAGSDELGRDVPVYGVDMRPPRDLPPADASTEDASTKEDVSTKPDRAVAIDGGGVDTGADLGGIITKYSTVVPDAAAEKPVIVPLYTALMPDTEAGADGPVVRYMAVMPAAAPELGLSAPDYMAQHPS